VLLMWWMLQKSRAILRKHGRSRLHNSLSLLHSPYEDLYPWWELVEIGRKLILVGLVRLITAAIGSLQQLFIGTVFATVFMFFVALSKPYKVKSDTFLASFVSFALVMFFVMCLVYHIGLVAEDFNDEMSEEAGRRIQIDSIFLTVLLFTCVISSLVVVISLFISELYAERRFLRVLSLEEASILLRTMNRLGGQRSSDESSNTGNSRRGTGDSSRSRFSGRSRGISMRTRSSFRKGLRSTKRFGRATPRVGQTSIKFSTASKLISGHPKDALLGLNHYMGVSDAAGEGAERIFGEWMSVHARLSTDDNFVRLLQPYYKRGEWEPSLEEARTAICDEISKWIKYVFQESCSQAMFHNGIRDKDRPANWTLKDFLEHEHAVEARLSPMCVVALRIYTTHLFKYLNGPMRRADIFGSGKVPHPFPLTLSCVAEGIKKLRATYVAAQKQSGRHANERQRLYRGMKSVDVGDDFLRDGNGGTEVPPLSTTTDLKVAVQYGLGAESLLFVLTVSSFMQYGADLSWLSAFPGEAEVCYPPLTYLHPTGHVEVVTFGGYTFKVVEVTPHIA